MKAQAIPAEIHMGELFLDWDEIPTPCTPQDIPVFKEVWEGYPDERQLKIRDSVPLSENEIQWTLMEKPEYGTKSGMVLIANSPLMAQVPFRVLRDSGLLEGTYITICDIHYRFRAIPKEIGAAPFYGYTNPNEKYDFRPILEPWEEDFSILDIPRPHIRASGKLCKTQHPGKLRPISRKLCETLGVQVGEMFFVNEQYFTIHSDGYLYNMLWPYGWNPLCKADTILQIINNREKIVHIPILTDEEKDRAYQIAQKLSFDWRHSISIQRAHNGELGLSDGKKFWMPLKSSFFPSILPGASFPLYITLTQII